MDEEPERIVINEALHGKNGTNNGSEIFEVLMQVKVNIPLLDMIKQVSAYAKFVKVNIPLLYMIKQVLTYAKFLKDLCIVKRGLNVNKKAFLTEQVSAII